MTMDDQGFILNLRGGYSEQARLPNTIRALALLVLPLSVATYANGRRLYFVGERPISEADKRTIIEQVLERFGLVTTLRCLGDALKVSTPAMPPEKLAAWRDANEDAKRARNAANARAMRLARDPGLADRRAEAAAERMAKAARDREARKAERAARHAAAPAEAPALARTAWLNSLVWNRRNRIQNLLATTAGASPEHSLTFARWLVGAARRGLEPGAPAFGVAFRGASELDAVTALEALAGPWLGISLAPDAQPSQLRAQVSDKLLIHASASDRRDLAAFSILAARTEDFIGDESEAIRRTFALACTLADDEAAPHGFREVRVTGFDLDSLRRDRDQLFAEARECAFAAMAKRNANELVRRKRLQWQGEYYNFIGGNNVR